MLDGLVNGICPNESCRGGEVIDGRLFALLKELAAAMQASMEEVMDSKNAEGTLEPLSPQSAAFIMDKFFRAIAYIEATAVVRFSWSSQ